MISPPPYRSFGDLHSNRLKPESLSTQSTLPSFILTCLHKKRTLLFSSQGLSVQMPALFNPITSLLSRLPNGLDKAVPVEVVPMTQELVDQWHHFVQPLIDKHYIFWKKGANPKVVRADKYWNWHDNFSLLSLHNALYANGGRVHGEAVAMCIVFRSPDGRQDFPIGMLTAIPKLQTNILNHVQARALTWYLSDAPDEVYLDILGIPVIHGVAKALIDCTIQSALDEFEGGSLVLKADPHGGEKLHEFYTRCGMHRIPKRHPAVTPFFRRIGKRRHYFFSDIEAQLFAQKFDARR